MKSDLDIPLVSSVFIILVALTLISIAIQSKVDGEIIKQKVDFFVKRITLYLLSIGIISAFCILLFNGKELVSNHLIKDIIDTGILTAISLPLMGEIIRYIYNKFFNNSREKNIDDIITKEQEADFEKVFVGSTFMSGAFLLLSIGDIYYFLFIVTIILGKYLWINTPIKKVLNSIIKTISINFISDNIFDISVVLLSLATMLISSKLAVETKANITLGMLIYLVFSLFILFAYIKHSDKKNNNG